MSLSQLICFLVLAESLVVMSLLNVGFFFELLWNKELSVNEGVDVLNSSPFLKASLCEDEMYCCKILYCSSVKCIPSLGAMRDLSIRK